MKGRYAVQLIHLDGDDIEIMQEYALPRGLGDHVLDRVVIREGDRTHSIKLVAQVRRES